MNFFTVPTVTFGMLYCFFIISHDRRRILLFNVTILAEELNAEVTADEALRCYERRLKYSIEKKRAVGRKMARWFVPENSSRLMMRDFALRLSNWPITSYMVGQSFAGDSIF
jgi:2-polyprenyl-6-methoxyphenol hydroxylase-like FAD-dependent oxidoreductase